MTGSPLLILLFSAFFDPSAGAATPATAISTPSTATATAMPSTASATAVTSTTATPGTPAIPTPPLATATLAKATPAIPTPSTPTPDTAGLLVSGSADLYYRYDLARTDKNELTSFTQSNNQFNLGMAEIKLEHKTTRVDMVADLAVGPREREYAYTDKGITQAIKQLYLSYSPTQWLKLTAGTWATHLCYESPDAAANRNYSMSYLFSNDPFSHTGLKAEFTSGRNGLMIGIANPSDYRSIPPGGYDNKNIIAQYSYCAGDNLKLYFNYVGGRDINDNRSHEYDFVLIVKPGTLFSLGFNGAVNRSSLATEKYMYSHSWWGSAVYLNLDPKPWLGFTLRTEYFDDRQGEKLPAPASVIASTLSANFKVDGFTFIPEFRLDNATTPIFFYHDGAPAHTAANFLLAAVYSF